MKRYNKIKLGLIAIIAVFTFSACKKNMDDLFQNPESFTETKIEYLLPTGIDYSLRQDYIDIYINHLLSIGQLTQVVAGTSDPVSGNYYLWTTDKGRWSDYFTNSNGMVSLKGIQQIYDYKSTDAQREEYKPFLAMAKILMAYNTAKATDLFDDIPYSDAFKAQNSLYNQPIIVSPKYDSQQVIYNGILGDLKESASILSTYTLNTAMYQTHASLPQQDILFQGNLSKWVKFANSLRLRYALRISGKDASKAKTEIDDLVNSNAPLITDNTDNAYLYKGAQIAGSSTGENTQLRAFAELTSQIYAPKLMVDQMTAANDPRLGVFFAKPSAATTIVGLDPSFDARNAAGLTGTTIPQRIASINPITFNNNTKLPTGTGITAADVNFLLAEATIKGLVTGKSFADATNYYNAGIQRSVEAYYSFYMLSPAGGKDPLLNVQPTAVVKAALVANPNYLLSPTNALQKIALQKWMNTNILQSYETFAEYRRLDLPVLLPDIKDGVQLNSADKLPVRLIIPSSETGSNNANYSAVASKNNQFSKVWWDVN